MYVLLFHSATSNWSTEGDLFPSQVSRPQTTFSCNESGGSMEAEGLHTPTRCLKQVHTSHNTSTRAARHTLLPPHFLMDFLMDTTTPSTCPTRLAARQKCQAHLKTKSNLVLQLVKQSKRSSPPPPCQWLRPFAAVPSTKSVLLSTTDAFSSP